MTWRTSKPQRFDRLTRQNGATALLGCANLERGSYGQLSLIVDSSSVVVGGVETPLTIASSAQTGVKTDLDADIAADTIYTLLLDYDAAKSVKASGNRPRDTPEPQRRPAGFHDPAFQRSE